MWSCSLLVTIFTSLLVITSPLRASHLFLLGYQPSINLAGWRQQTRTENESSSPCLFFCRALEVFEIVIYLSSGKMDLAAHKVKFLDTYLILYHELTYPHSVKGNKNHKKYGFASVKCDQVTFKLYRLRFSS